MAGAPMSAAFCGEGTAPSPAALTATLEKLAEVVTPAEWLVTARPTYTLLPSETRIVLIVVHCAPSVDVEAVMLVPVRTRRTNRGAPMPAVKPALTVESPVALRCWNVTPGAGV